MASRSQRRSATPLGRHCRRKAVASTAAGCCSRCRIGSTCSIWCRLKPVMRDGVTMLRRPEEDWRRREGFALTDRGTDLTGALDQANYCIWCHNQGKDSCSTGLREKDGAFKKTRLRRHPRRLPARGKDLRDEFGEGARQLGRRPRHRHCRQPALCGDRAPHLQRLHEGLHLSAAGSGRHSADRDPHSERRARAALGFRDLLVADPVEPAQHPAAIAEAGNRPTRCSSSGSARPALRWRTTL